MQHSRNLNLIGGPKGAPAVTELTNPSSVIFSPVSKTGQRITLARIRKTRLLSSTNSAAPGHGLCLVLQYQTMMVWHCLWTKAAMFFFSDHHLKGLRWLSPWITFPTCDAEDGGYHLQCIYTHISGLRNLKCRVGSGNGRRVIFAYIRVPGWSLRGSCSIDRRASIYLWYCSTCPIIQKTLHSSVMRCKSLPPIGVCNLLASHFEVSTFSARPLVTDCH